MREGTAIRFLVAAGMLAALGVGSLYLLRSGPWRRAAELPPRPPALDAAGVAAERVHDEVLLLAQVSPEDGKEPGGGVRSLLPLSDHERTLYARYRRAGVSVPAVTTELIRRARAGASRQVLETFVRRTFPPDLPQLEALAWIAELKPVAPGTAAGTAVGEPAARPATRQP